ncbi:MAG: ATP-binding protein, partial [Nodosilinea sp.]
RQVETRTAELVQTQVHLERSQRLESLGTLASGLGHDLSNTLTPLTAGADLLLLPHFELSVKARDVVEIMSSSARRSVDLVQHLLLFARGGSGERVPLVLDRLLAEILALVQRTLSSSIVVNPVTGADGSTWVEADPTQMHQVLMNLCLNACDAMAAGGVLSITLETCRLEPGDPRLAPPAAAGCYRVVTVADTGSGIEPSVIDRIFDPFFTTKALGEGTGLGLAVTFGIVKSHGGFIQVSSSMGNGSQFRVYLPALAAPAPAPALLAQLLHGHGERVLIADDNAAVRQTTGLLLENYGYIPLTVADGTAALAQYEQGRANSAEAIDLVLLDIDMPRPSGLEILRMLIALDPHLGVVVMSGSEHDQEEILAAGARAFITKPYRAQEMLLALDQALHPS